MSSRGARVCGCGCGSVVQSGDKCPRTAKREQERKARHDANRPTARERGYDSKWDRERAAFLAVNPTCKRCPAPATVVDHVQPHKGNPKLFWSRSNWQALCRPCHARWKQVVEHREGHHG